MGTSLQDVQCFTCGHVKNMTLITGMVKKSDR